MQRQIFRKKKEDEEFGVLDMKAKYEGIEFDSDLEVEYYKYLEEGTKNGSILSFKYHPSQIPNLVGTRAYTPDFIVYYDDRVEVIETKGWNQFTYRIDEQIHNAMLLKTEDWLREYVKENSNFVQSLILIDAKVIYRKIKYLKSHGWVDYDFKNPNTLSNKRKEKISILEAELKDLKNFKKETIRYFTLINKKQKKKKNQQAFIDDYLKKIQEEI